MAPGRAVLLLGLLLILQLWARDAEAAPQRDRSSSVPGGLRTWQAPQFVLLTHDDALDAPSYKLVHQIVAGLKNSNGCAIPATFFLTAAYSSCKVVQGAYAAGHEIAAHTLHHPHMRELSAAKQIKEVLGLRDYARKCGVPAAAVQGYRSPYLESSPTQLATLKLAGYRFDSSQSELWPGTAKNRSNWPYTLDNGLRACGWAPAGTCTGTRAPGVWEVPLYYFTPSKNVPRWSRMDPPAPYEALTQDLALKFNGSRAPVMIPVHSLATGYLTGTTGQRNIAEIRRFLVFALTKHPDVWVVTIKQLLDWMEAPVPATEMAAFMKQRYACKPPRR